MAVDAPSRIKEGDILYIEAKVHNISFLDDVFATFEAEQPLLPNRGGTPTIDKIGIRKHFGTDKATLHIGMYLAYVLMV